MPQLVTGKVFIVCLALVCLTVLMVAGSIDSELGAGLFLYIFGYATGNGVTALRGKQAQPLVRPKPTDDREDVAA